MVALFDTTYPIPDQSCGANTPTKCAKSANFVMKSYRKLGGFAWKLQGSWHKTGWFMQKGAISEEGAVAFLVRFHRQNGKIGKMPIDQEEKNFNRSQYPPSPDASLR